MRRVLFVLLAALLAAGIAVAALGVPSVASVPAPAVVSE
jgi:hypothetical protein